MNRRQLLKLGLGASALFALKACKSPKRNIVLFNSGANAKLGHQLRSGNFPEPIEQLEVNTLIVGAGVSGLSTGYYLNKFNNTNFVILELDKQNGGNSRSGENSISRYPYGAHYLPIPSTDMKELINFLHENGIIAGFNQQGLPVYNDYHLCFEPEERLYFKGKWQENLLPKNGISESDKKEFNRFFALMEELKWKKGSDNLYAFTLPASNSSKDNTYTQLDIISMEDYLKQNNFNSPILHWYINYGCKDDFGTTLSNTSAWAGIHYFTSRKGNADNAKPGDQLTWPEGNGYLVNLLQKPIVDKIKNNQLAYLAERHNEQWHINVFDVHKNTSIKYVCNNLVLATPQYINKKIFPGITKHINTEAFQYFPWLVANITISTANALKATIPLSWDNVNFYSPSLGYIHALHQSVKKEIQKTVITYYYPFCTSTPKTERQLAYSKSNDNWKKLIIDDLILLHPDIEQHIEEIDIHLHGHAMVAPLKGLRQQLPKTTQITSDFFLTNTDISGLSLFEEAFYNGYNTARLITTNNT